MSDKWTVHDFDQAPVRASRPRRRRPSPLQRTHTERRAFNGALGVSALLHLLLLSQMVGEGQGVPGLVLPWQERRAVVPDIQTVLVSPPPAPAASAPPPSAAVDVQRASIRSAPVEVLTPKPPAPRPPEPAVAEAPAPRPAPPAEAPRNTVAEAVPVNPSPPPPRAEVPARTPPPPPSPPPPVLTAEPTDVPTPVVPVAPEPVLAASAVEPSASRPDPVALAKREAALEAQRLEAERQEAARQQAAAQLEAQRQEAARQAAVRAEAARLEAVRLETERQEAARQAAARAEAARLETERQEAARQAAARAEAARLEAERQEAARQAAVRAEAARLEAERQEAARQEAARAQAAQQEAAAKREAVLRAIGRQLDEERARRDAAANATPSPSGALPLSLSTARRARLFGHTDPNADLVAYAQAWALKIQLNTLPDKVREVARRPHTPATVTVALRRDGSVESVTFVVSSGVAEIDDAIRRIIDTQRPYPAFAPNLAREFDVIEIRRTWYFDAAVRLH